VPLAEVTLRPVAPRPAKIFCVGLDYLDHVGEAESSTLRLGDSSKIS
jgi:acylpyruvate hydrolase